MDILQQLMRDEGFRQFPYRDSVGKETIGYGFNLADTGLTHEEANLVLRIRVRRLLSRLRAALPGTHDMDEARLGVLLNMAYNMGLDGLLQFRHALQFVWDGKYEEAAEAMLQSKWAEQVGARAQRLALQMRTGEWQ